MDHQMMFNIGIGIISSMLGWWLNNVWTALKDLQDADRELAEKVASIEVLVAGQYVTRDEFNNVLSQVFTKLDRIIEKLSEKADR
jgi:hypothetical protein